MSVSNWMRQRPWIWLVILVGLFLLLDLIFMSIAIYNRPIQVGRVGDLPDDEFAVAQMVYPAEGSHAAEPQLNSDDEDEGGAEAMEEQAL